MLLSKYQLKTESFSNVFADWSELSFAFSDFYFHLGIYHFSQHFYVAGGALFSFKQLKNFNFIKEYQQLLFHLFSGLTLQHMKNPLFKMLLILLFLLFYHPFLCLLFYQEREIFSVIKPEHQINSQLFHLNHGFHHLAILSEKLFHQQTKHIIFI